MALREISLLDELDIELQSLGVEAMQINSLSTAIRDAACAFSCARDVRASPSGQDDSNEISWSIDLALIHQARIMALHAIAISGSQSLIDDAADIARSVEAHISALSTSPAASRRNREVAPAAKTQGHRPTKKFILRDSRPRSQQQQLSQQPRPQHQTPAGAEARGERGQQASATPVVQQQQQQQQRRSQRRVQQQ